MSKTDVEDYLDAAGACGPSLQWVSDLPESLDAEDIWGRCLRAEWMLWLLVYAKAPPAPLVKIFRDFLMRLLPVWEHRRSSIEECDQKGLFSKTLLDDAIAAFDALAGVVECGEDPWSSVPYGQIRALSDDVDYRAVQRHVSSSFGAALAAVLDRANILLRGYEARNELAVLSTVADHVVSAVMYYEKSYRCAQTLLCEDIRNHVSGADMVKLMALTGQSTLTLIRIDGRVE